MSTPQGAWGAFPPRPTLTVVFTSAMFFWAACALAYATGDMRPACQSATIAAASAGIALLAIACSLWARLRMPAIVVASLAIGALLGSSQAFSIHMTAEHLSTLENAPVTLTLLEDSSDYGFGESALVEATFNNGTRAVCTAKLGNCEPLLAGERLGGQACFSAADYASDARAWREGSCGTLKITGSSKTSVPVPLEALIGLRRRALDTIGAEDERHALLQALACGYRRNIANTDLYSCFQTCGLAHLVAVSGAHLVIVTGLAGSVLKRLRAPRRLTIALLITLMASYYVLAGMPVSALRATVMSTLGLLAFFGHRRPSSLNAVGIGMFALVTLSPASSVSASLTLSALSTTGIVLFSPLASAWLNRSPLAHAPFACEALGLTCSAALLSQLYACSLFYQLPLMSPVANIACAPLFPFVCGTGLLSGLIGAFAPPIAPLLDIASVVCSGVLEALVTFLAAVPYAAIPFFIETAPALCASATLAFLIWITWPRPTASTALTVVGIVCTCALVFLLAHDWSDKIVMLDVGQGDAILIESNSHTLLIDTGNEDALLLEELAKNQVIHLDGVLITHADDDHCGSLDMLARTVNVDRVIVATDMITCTDPSARSLMEQAHAVSDTVIGLDIGDTFPIGSFTARVVWPHSFTENGGNADSLCTVLTRDGDGDGNSDTTALMTGDAEHEEIARMLEEGLVGPVDILKVGHHGSKNGLTADEAHSLHPTLALVSCGLNNRYGHPAAETLEMLAEAGASIYRTDQNGTITCTFENNAPTVSCETG